MLVVDGQYPPIFGRIELEFPEVTRRASGVIFCWGRVIFNPYRGTVTPELHAHELVHSRQQLGAHPATGTLTEEQSMADDLAIRGWWERYLTDVPFRLEQEIPAYHAQYVAHRKRRGATKAAAYLAELARQLSGPMYGGVIRFEDAFEAIVIGFRALPAGETAGAGVTA